MRPDSSQPAHQPFLFLNRNRHSTTLWLPSHTNLANSCASPKPERQRHVGSTSASKARGLTSPTRPSGVMPPRIHRLLPDSDRDVPTAEARLPRATTSPDDQRCLNPKCATGEKCAWPKRGGPGTSAEGSAARPTNTSDGNSPRTYGRWRSLWQRPAVATRPDVSWNPNSRGAVGLGSATCTSPRVPEADPNEGTRLPERLAVSPFAKLATSSRGRYRDSEAVGAKVSFPQEPAPGVCMDQDASRVITPGVFWPSSFRDFVRSPVPV